VLLNALVSIWCGMLQAEVPDASPSAFADDTGATTLRRGCLHEVARATQEFADLSGQTLNADKSYAFHTEGGKATSILLKGSKLPWKASAKHLGGFLEFRRQGVGCGETDKIEACCSVASKVAWLPLGFYGRQSILQTLVLPKALFACEVSRTQKRPVARLSSAVMKAVWGAGRRQQCKEIVLTLMLPGHRVDPEQVVAYKSFATLRRVLTANPQWRGAFQATWRAASSSRSCVYGPVGRLFAIARSIGWTWPDPWLFQRASGESIPFLEFSEQRWQHEVRDALRHALWAKACSRRPDMIGFESGVDRTATTCLLRSRTLSHSDGGALRTIVSGAVLTRHRLCRNKLCPDNICQFCQTTAVENEQHLWWECPAWDAIRGEHMQAMLAYSPDWPTCFRWCGIMPERHPAFDNLLELLRPPMNRQHVSLESPSTGRAE
jgi:hypothetical protein